MLAKGHDLWIVTQAEAIESLQPLRENLTRIGYAGYVVELLDRFTYEEGQNWQLYQLLVETLKRLSLEEEAFVPVRYYEMRLLDLLGLPPVLFECALCGQDHSSRRPVLLCRARRSALPDCGLRVNEYAPSRWTHCAICATFSGSTYNEAKRADPGKDTRAEVETLLNYYLTYLLGSNLNHHRSSSARSSGAAIKETPELLSPYILIDKYYQPIIKTRTEKNETISPWVIIAAIVLSIAMSV